MKLKQHLVITDPAAFLKGNYSSCFALFDHKAGYHGWIDAGIIEFDVNVDSGLVLKTAQAELDEEIGKATAVLNVLEQRKAELLALPAPNFPDQGHKVKGGYKEGDGTIVPNEVHPQTEFGENT